MEELFHLVASCGDDVLRLAEGTMTLPVSLFLIGAAGSAVHCVGMCGPFVLGQVIADADRDSSRRYGEWRRLAGAALLPYHLGRATTYTALGAAAGAATALFVSTAFFHELMAVLLLLAAALLVAQALGYAVGRNSPYAIHLTRLARPFAASRTLLDRYVLGVILGFLPCGLLYGAIAVAGGSGSPWLGGLGMASFALGTMPALVLVGWLGTLARRRLQEATRWIAAPLLLANAALMTALAIQRF